MSLPQNVRFGPFDLDTHSGELRNQGLKVRLPHQSFQILTALLEKPGVLVTREELRQKLWPGETFVNFDAGVGSALRKLREALGDTAESPRFVETLPKHGYRFIAPVDGVGESAAEPASTPLPTATVVTPLSATPATTSRRWRLALVVGVALVSAAAAALLFLDLDRWRDRLSSFGDPPRVRSIAVLAMENLTGDPGQDALVEAVSDSLTTELVRAGLIEVASRTSTAQFRHSRIGVTEIARRLNVDAVVEGTISRSGDRWLVNIQLIDGSSDRHLWAQRYERELGEIATLPRELAWEILGAIPPHPQSPNERGHARRRPANEEAYAAYVLGRHFLAKRGAQNVTEALGYFQLAIEKDPEFGPAHSGLSDAWRIGAIDGLPEENLSKAEAAARRALELDANLAEAHTSLGGVLWRHWKWEEAERELRRALELEPNYAEGYRVYGMFLTMLRRPEEAVAALGKAHQLDRLSATISVEYAGALTWAGRYDEALHELEQARTLDPTFWRIPQGIAFVRAARKDWTGAIAALEQGPSTPSDRPASAWLGYYYAAAGRNAEALQVLEEFEASDRGDVRSTAMGIVHLGLGDREKALDYLERGIKERPADVGFTAVLYDLLKDEPRYQAILDEMGVRFTS